MKKLIKFVKLRAKEPTTYAGLAILATAAGLPAVGVTLDKVAMGLALILGGGLAAMSQHPDDNDRA